MDLPFHLVELIANKCNTPTLVSIHKTCKCLCGYTHDKVKEKKFKNQEKKFCKHTSLLMDNFSNNLNPPNRKKKTLYALFDYQLRNASIWTSNTPTWIRYREQLKIH